MGFVSVSLSVACCVVVVVVVVEEGEGSRKRGETNRAVWLLIPAKASLKIAETEQLYQGKANDWRNRETCCSRSILKLKMCKIKGLLW